MFACKCEICLKDVKLGNHLRCRICSGSVPFDSPINQEPTLHGKCLQCNQVYEHFDKSVKQLNDAKKAIKCAYKLSFLLPCHMIISSHAFKLAKKIVDLSLVNDHANHRYIEFASLIVEQQGPQFSKTKLEDKVKVAFFFDKHLSTNATFEMINDKM